MSYIRLFILVILVPLNFSCSSSNQEKPKDAIIGKWIVSNLSDVNDHRKKITDLPPPYDPIIERKMTYYLDGTGIWSDKYKSGKSKSLKFLYQFILENEYKLQYEADNAIELYKINYINKNAFSEILSEVKLNDLNLDIGDRVPTIYRRISN